MVNKHYPAQFKADAVALYRSRPGATWPLRLDEPARGKTGRRRDAVVITVSGDRVGDERPQHRREPVGADRLGCERQVNLGDGLAVQPDQQPRPLVLSVRVQLRQRHFQVYIAD